MDGPKLLLGWLFRDQEKAMAHIEWNRNFQVTLGDDNEAIKKNIRDMSMLEQIWYMMPKDFLDGDFSQKGPDDTFLCVHERTPVSVDSLLQTRAYIIEVITEMSFFSIQGNDEAPK